MAIKFTPALKEKILDSAQQALGESPDLSTPPWEDHIPLATQQASGSVHIAHVDNKEKVVVAEKETLVYAPAPTAIPKDKLASVTLGGGMTINLGNYQSAKVSVYLTLPSHVDSIDETYEKAKEWVSEKIKDAVTDAQGIAPSEEHL